MTDSLWVSYAADGTTITGVYTGPQVFPTTKLAADDPTIAAHLAQTLAQFHE